MHATWTATLVIAPLLMLACDQREAAPAHGGPATTAAASGEPKVAASGSVTDGAPIDGLTALVDGMRPDFARCYASAIEKDPKMAGAVRVTLDVGSSGAIGSLSTAASKGISKELASCIDSRIRREKFGAPKGPRATIMITVDVSR